MTIKNAIEAMLQRFRGQTAVPEAMPEPYIGDDPWLIELYGRLQRELDGLYEKAEPDNTDARQRIARILRAFHLMETGEYGLCACCDMAISRIRLEADPTRDTCEACG